MKQKPLEKLGWKQTKDYRSISGNYKYNRYSHEHKTYEIGISNRGEFDLYDYIDQVILFEELEAIYKTAKQTKEEL